MLRAESTAVETVVLLPCQPWPVRTGAPNQSAHGQRSAQRAQLYPPARRFRDLWLCPVRWRRSHSPEGIHPAPLHERQAMSHLTVASVRLTQPETDHAARIVEALRAKGRLSYPQIARQLGYASHAQLVRLVKHRKRISRAKYEELVRWSNGQPPTGPTQPDLPRTPGRERMRGKKATEVPGRARAQARTATNTGTSGGAAGAATPSRWGTWARRLRALPAAVASTMLRVA